MKTNFILIDFENTQPAKIGLLNESGVQIKIFAGASQKVPLELASELQKLGPIVEYIRMEGNGRNALDFHIAYYIGRLSAAFPDAHFHIFSKDTGFDPLIKHLARQGISCHRSATLGEIPSLRQDGPALLPPQTVDKIAAHLIKLGTSRPRRLKTLTATLKALLNHKATEAEITELIDQFAQRGILNIIEAGKVTYPAPETAK